VKEGSGRSQEERQEKVGSEMRKECGGGERGGGVMAGKDRKWVAARYG